MTMHSLRRAAPLAAAAIAALLATIGPAGASDSSSFDRACANYYRQGNDTDVTADIAEPFCTCLANQLQQQGLGQDALEFFARTYSDDLTTFIDEYPQGEAWMQQSFRADKQCKNVDYGTHDPPLGEDFPFEAGSWGGIVRSGPGRDFSRLDALAEGERITIIKSTGIIDNDYLWFKIRYRGNREGYQWGGIVCGLDKPIDGAFETCP
jgi:hypothetical protein